MKLHKIRNITSKYFEIRCCSFLLIFWWYPNKLSYFFLYRGHIVNLWPLGYKNEVKICCPSMELHQYVHDHYLKEVIASMPIRGDLLKKAEETKNKIAKQLKKDIDDLTFIGIHDR